MMCLAKQTANNAVKEAFMSKVLHCNHVLLLCLIMTLDIVRVHRLDLQNKALSILGRLIVSTCDGG